MLQRHYALHRAPAANHLLAHAVSVELLAPAVREEPLPCLSFGIPLQDVLQLPMAQEEHYPLHGQDNRSVTGLAAPRQSWIGSPVLHTPEAQPPQPPRIPLETMTSSPSGSTGAAARASCPHCEKTFSREADMERHAKKHLPEAKTFQCFVEGCRYNGEKGFYRRDKLMAHQRAKHGLLV